MHAYEKIIVLRIFFFLLESFETYPGIYFDSYECIFFATEFFARKYFTGTFLYSSIVTCGHAWCRLLS